MLGAELGKALDGEKLLALFGLLMIVPGLIAATAMPLRNAIGTSLVVVTSLGLTTAASYAFSGLVDWQLTGLLFLGGVAGALVGIALGKLLAARKGMLEKLFAALVVSVGGYILTQSF